MKDKNYFLVLAFISLLVVVLRAIYVPMFHDEVVTFNHFVKSGIISPFSEYRAANNHLTNSLFSRFFYLLFGDSPFSLRFANVLAFIPYCYFLFRLGRGLSTNVVRWGFYLSLLFSFQFVAFFGLSRGYGIALASMLSSIYFLTSFIKQVKVNTLIFVCLSLLLGLFAFFSLLLFVFISIGIIGYLLFLNRKKIGVRKWIGLASVLIPFFGAIGFAIYVLFYYKSYGILWFGFLDGFWKNTVITLIQLVFRPFEYQILFEILVIIFSIVIVISTVIKITWRKLLTQHNIWFWFLGFNVLGILLLAWFFHVNYPYQRTGLHLYLLFIGAFCFAIDKIERKALKTIFAFPLFLIPIHYVLSFNFDYISQWQEDTLPYSFFEVMKNEEKRMPKDYNSSFYIEGTQRSVWTYGVNYWFKELPQCSSSFDSLTSYYDYIVNKKNNMMEINHLYDSIDGQPYSDVILYKRKKSVKKLLFKSFKVDTTVISTKDQIFTSFVIDSLGVSSLWFDFKTNIRFTNYPVHVYLVFSVENPSTHEKYSYKFIEFDRLIKWNDFNPLIYTELANNLPKDEPLQINVYLWNRYERSYEITNSDLKIYKIEE